MAVSVALRPSRCVRRARAIARPLTGIASAASRRTRPRTAVAGVTPAESARHEVVRAR